MARILDREGPDQMAKEDLAVEPAAPIDVVEDGHLGVTTFDASRLKAKRVARRRVGFTAVILDLSAIATAYIVVSLLYFKSIMLEMIAGIWLSGIPIFLIVSLDRSSYSIDILIDRSRSFWRGLASLAWASLVMSLILFFLKISDEFSRVLLGFGTLMALSLIGLSRLAIAQSARRLFGESPMANVIIYDGVYPREPTSEAVLIAKNAGIEPNSNDPIMLERLGQLAHSVDSLVVHCPQKKREQWAFMLKSLDVATEIVTPEITGLRPLAIRERSGQTSLVIGSGKLNLSQRAIKRGFDLFSIAVALPLLAPLLIVTALAIKADSRGPVLFQQERIGLGNRKFKILKFRTMHVDQQDQKAQKSTRRDDPRVTRLGQFLRRTSLDELPQIFNVLIGDMSIVGPRPHAERTSVGSTLLWEIDAAYWHRHVVKPGITGLAQIRGHRGSLFEEIHLKERLNADLEYVANWSLANDVKIIFQTLGVLVHKNAF